MANKSGKNGKIVKIAMIAGAIIVSAVGVWLLIKKKKKATSVEDTSTSDVAIVGKDVPKPSKRVVGRKGWLKPIISDDLKMDENTKRRLESDKIWYGSRKGMSKA
jgi:hypothetical protein